jgi:hypothetical protein
MDGPRPNHAVNTEAPTGGAARLGGRRLPWFVRRHKGAILAAAVSGAQNLSCRLGR